MQHKDLSKYKDLTKLREQARNELNRLEELCALDNHISCDNDSPFKYVSSVDGDAYTVTIKLNHVHSHRKLSRIARDSIRDSQNDINRMIHKALTKEYKRLLSELQEEEIN